MTTERADEKMGTLSIFHCIMIAGARKVANLAAFRQGVVEESRGDYYSPGAIALARVAARRADQRSARVHAYVTERACR